MFLGSIISTVAGGGLGIMALLLSTLFFDIRFSIVLSSFMMVAIQIAKFTYFHSLISWRTVRWYVVLGIPFSYVGGYLLFVIPENIPKIAIVVFCFLFVALRILKLQPKVSPTRTNLLLFGAINGAIGGLIGNASLMRLPVLLSMGFTKGAFIGTSTAIAFPMNIAKIAAYIPNVSWTNDMIIILLSSIPLFLLGVGVGKRILRHISSSLFEDLLTGIIFIGALRLLFTL